MDQYTLHEAANFGSVAAAEACLEATETRHGKAVADAASPAVFCFVFDANKPAACSLGAALRHEHRHKGPALWEALKQYVNEATPEF